MGLRRFLRNLKKRYTNQYKKIIYQKFPNIFDKEYSSIIQKSEKWISEVNNNLKSVTIPENALNNIKYIKNDTISKLSWCAKLTKNKTIVNYGSDVFKHKNGIIEGVWDDNFNNMSYIKAKHVFGSGITYYENKLVFTPPSHMYENIFCIFEKEQNILILSNSLSFCLSLISSKIDDLLNIVEKIRVNNDQQTKEGVLNYNPILFENCQLSIYGFYYHNINISSKYIYLSLRKNITKFLNFDEYNQYLLNIMNNIIENAKSKERKINYLPISSISKGYDSPAVSSLLRKLGKFDTVTIDVNIYGNNDSGKIIANNLDLPCFVCTHPLGENIDDIEKIEYPKKLISKINEFIATVGLGDDLVFLSFDNYLNEKLIFSGALGDSIWDASNKPPFGIPVRIPFGKSLNEYRLRKGFFHIPLPVIGSVFPSYIYRINFLKEMDEFHSDKNYNRPIPRKIIETSGIKRGTFANGKTATNPNPINLKKFKKEAFEIQIAKYSFKEYP